MQVEVTDVRADRRGTRQPDLSIHVGAVHVYLTAVLVDDGADVADLLLEHAVRRGIGHHQRCQRIPMLRRPRAKIGEIDVAVAVARHHHDPQPSHRRARRVRAVS